MLFISVYSFSLIPPNFGFVMMFEVWQNSAPFGSRPIGGTVEALSTKVVNQQSSVLPIVVFL
jgi:hypothetical protein